jgi:hypothetical protein
VRATLAQMAVVGIDPDQVGQHLPDEWLVQALTGAEEHYWPILILTMAATLCIKTVMSGPSQHEKNGNSPTMSALDLIADKLINRSI